MNSWKNNKDFSACYETLRHGIIKFYMIFPGDIDGVNESEFVNYIMEKEFDKDSYYSYTGNDTSTEWNYMCNIEIFQNGRCCYVIRNKSGERKDGIIQLRFS